MSDLNDAIAEALAKLDFEFDGETGSDQEQPEVVQDTVDDDGEAAVENTEEVNSGSSDDEGEGSGDEPESDEADTSGEPELVELSRDQKVVIDGKEGTVEDLLELKSDYTRKTQALAEREREVEQQLTEVRDWYEAKTQDPVAWVKEIAEATGDPTALLAAVIKAATDEGLLDEQFVKTFNLAAPDNPVRKRAADGDTERKLRELEQRLAERDEREQQAARQRELMVEYERQVQNIIAVDGLSFESDLEENRFRVELFEFAKSSGLTDNLEHAYAVMSRERERSARRQRKQAEETAVKKRATAVVAKKSGTPVPANRPEQISGDYADVARAAFARLEAEGRL